MQRCTLISRITGRLPSGASSSRAPIRLKGSRNPLGVDPHRHASYLSLSQLRSPLALPPSSWSPSWWTNPHRCRLSAFRAGHTVRIIVQEELLDREGRPVAAWSKGDVVRVAAGYARNYLLPHKKALYATRHNFRSLGMKDPDHETVEERRIRLEREVQEGSDQNLQAYHRLSQYLRNKTLQIWRNADPTTGVVSPGMVDAKAVRRKLSKQLKIDLEPHEKVHLHPHLVPDLDNLGPEELDDLLRPLGRGDDTGESADDSEPLQPCTVQIRQLGSFLARISLAGGYTVPLKLEILKR